MKLKKILGITGVAIASVALLAACSSKSKEASKSSGAKETINFATVGTTAPFSYEENGELTGTMWKWPKPSSKTLTNMK